MKTITRAKYLDRIIELNGTPDIEIITGIRRSGKSKLMQDVYKRQYTKIFPAMFTVLDHKFCVGDPMVLFMEGKHVNVPVMSGNTSRCV